MKAYSEAAQQALDRLMGELANGSRCTEDTLRAVVEDPNAHLYIVREEGQIVASACLCVAHTTEQQIGFVEAVAGISGNELPKYNSLYSRNLRCIYPTVATISLLHRVNL